MCVCESKPLRLSLFLEHDILAALSRAAARARARVHRNIVFCASWTDSDVFRRRNSELHLIKQQRLLMHQGMQFVFRMFVVTDISTDLEA